ncbi:hypothetical protein [Mammaliicoccus sciuri]|uniref:hypothetical protein n=1 Tax=Mammaliicoccus sciuri TaxID=1296 RepID=UPI001330FBF1|nr:hypothetical protein [Mammaliicoccus sciuri]
MKKYILISFFCFAILLEGCSNSVDKKIEGQWYIKDTGKKWFNIENGRMYKGNKGEGEKYTITKVTDHEVTVIWDKGNNEINSEFEFVFTSDNNMQANEKTTLIFPNGEKFEDSTISIEKHRSYWNYIWLILGIGIGVVLLFGIVKIIKKYRQ